MAVKPFYLVVVVEPSYLVVAVKPVCLVVAVHRTKKNEDNTFVFDSR